MQLRVLFYVLSTKTKARRNIIKIIAEDRIKSQLAVKSNQSKAAVISHMPI